MLKLAHMIIFNRKLELSDLKVIRSRCQIMETEAPPSEQT